MRASILGSGPSSRSPPSVEVDDFAKLSFSLARLGLPQCILPLHVLHTRRSSVASFKPHGLVFRGNGGVMPPLGS